MSDDEVPPEPPRAQWDTPTIKITALYTQASVDALNATLARSPHTQTDVMNRALAIYNYLDEVWAQGGQVYIRRTDEEPMVLRRLEVW